MSDKLNSRHIDALIAERNNLMVRIKKLNAIIRREKVSASLLERARLGKTVGRPRKCNPKKILKLRQSGLSLNHIAKKLSLSKGAVQYALKALNISYESK